MIYIIGAPGTGKSSTVKKFVEQYGDWGQEQKWCREAWYHEIAGLKQGDAWMWGRLAENSKGGFMGTDGMGKAASRYIREWLEAGGQLPALSIAEGERLAYWQFLTVLDKFSYLTVVFLERDAEARRASLLLRDGNDKRMTGGMSARMANLADQLELVYGVDLVRIDTTGLTPDEVAQDINAII